MWSVFTSERASADCVVLGTHLMHYVRAAMFLSLADLLGSLGSDVRCHELTGEATVYREDVCKDPA